MLTDRMTLKEIVAEVKRDNEFISDASNREVERNYNAYHVKLKMLKKMHPEYNYYVLGVKKIKCPKSQNVYYMIMGYNLPNKEFIIQKIGIMTDRNGKRQLVTASYDDILGEQVYIYSSHLLSRYRERYLKNESIDFDELVKKFIFDSKNGMLTSRIQWNFKRKSNPDEKTAAEITQIGCNLGVVDESGKVIFKTFVSSDMLKDNQQFDIEVGDSYFRMLNLFDQELIQESFSYFGH